MDAPNRFAKVMKAYMKQEDVDVQTLSALSGLSDASLYNYLNGKSLPREETCREIARALGQDEDSFVGVMKRAKGEGGDEPSAKDEASEPSCSDDGADEGESDRPPWEREPDRWERCRKQSAGGLGTDAVTIRKDGGVYLSAGLARAAGLAGRTPVNVYRSGGRGGLHAESGGVYSISQVSDCNGYKLTATRFKDWVDGGSMRAPVTGYGDGWVAFERPEEE